MIVRLVEAFGLFVVAAASGVILKMVAEVITWITFEMVLEIAGVAGLMWLLPLGLTPTKKLVVKLMERWKNIDI